MTFTESNIVVRFRKMYVLCPMLFFLCLCVSLSMYKDNTYLSYCASPSSRVRVGVEVRVRVRDSVSSSSKGKGKGPFVFVL